MTSRGSKAEAINKPGEARTSSRQSANEITHQSSTYEVDRSSAVETGRTRRRRKDKSRTRQARSSVQGPNFDEDVVARTTDSSLFVNTVLVIICLNTIVIAFETILIDNRSLAVDFENIERFFTAFYAAEVSFRIYESGISDFFVGEDWTWNWFDFIITTSAVADTIVHALLHGSGFASSLGRLFRVLRVFRAARVFELSHMERVEYMFLTAMNAAMKLALLVCTTLFVFAILTTNIYYNSGSEQAELMFGTLGASMWSLFVIMTLDNWEERIEGVYEVRPHMRWFFTGFVFVAAIAVMSLVPAIFIELHMSSLKAEEMEKLRKAEELRKKKESDMLRTVYHIIDADQSGTASGDEIEEVLTDPYLSLKLREVGFTDETEIRDVTLKLFEMSEEMQENPPSGTRLDNPKDFEVGCDEFVVEFMRKSDDASLTKLWRCITSSRIYNRTTQASMKRDIMTVLAQIEEMKCQSPEIEAHFKRLVDADINGVREGDESSKTSLESRVLVAESVADLARQRLKDIQAAIEAKLSAE